MFALMFATYFYLRTRSTDWPPGHLPPALKYGAANAVIFLLSIIPAWIVRKRAPEGDRRAVRNGLLVLTLFALAATVLRVFEFTALNCRWTDDAYSSTDLGPDRNALGASGDRVDRNHSSAGYFVYSKDGRNAPRRCRDQFRLLVFRGGHGVDCGFVDLRDDSIFVRGRMAKSEQQIQSGRTPAGLWWSLAAGFAAWGLDLGLSYLLERHTCSTGDGSVLHLISVACFANCAVRLRNRPGGIQTLSRHHIGRRWQPFRSGALSGASRYGIQSFLCFGRYRGLGAALDSWSVLMKCQ